jgi:lysophospholipase L1-like esterase
VPFLFFSNAHLKVTVTDADGVADVLTLTTDYTVTGANDPTGGDVTTVIAYDDTHTVKIERVLPFTQPFVYEEGGRLPMKTLEKSFDWIVQQVQWVWNYLSTALALRPTTTTVETMISDAQLEGPTSDAVLALLGIDSISGDNTGDETAARVLPLLPIKQVIFTGDSISAPSTNSLGNSCWVRQVKKYLPVASGATFTELAVEGRTAQTEASEIATITASRAATYGEGLVFVAFGTNDVGAGRTPAQLVADLQTITLAWQAKGFKVCIVGPPTATNDNDDAEAASILLAAASWPDYFVDLYTLTYERNDYVHPTAKGSAQIARIVAATITGSAQAPRISRMQLPVKATKAITSISAANPAVVTCTGHGYATGQLVYISGTTGGTSPAFTPLNGGVYAVTVIDANSFSIPVNVSVGATGGTANNAVVVFDSKLIGADYKTYLLHMYAGGGGDQGSFLATAMNGYNEAIFGFLRIAKTTFNMGSSDPMSGVNMYANSQSTLYLVNNSADFAYYIAGQELFASYR